MRIEEHADLNLEQLRANAAQFHTAVRIGVMNLIDFYILEFFAVEKFGNLFGGKTDAAVVAEIDT